MRENPKTRSMSAGEKETTAPFGVEPRLESALEEALRLARNSLLSGLGRKATLGLGTDLVAIFASAGLTKDEAAYYAHRVVFTVLTELFEVPDPPPGSAAHELQQAARKDGFTPDGMKWLASRIRSGRAASELPEEGSA